MILINDLKYMFYILLLMLVQVVIFNNIDFMGYSNPYFYVLFIIMYPLNRNKYLFLFYAFILGLSVDLFENTGGVNAFVSVFLAYIRPYIIKITTIGNTIEREELDLGHLSKFQWFIYLILIIFTHHFLIDYLEYFKWDMIVSVLIKSLIGSTITLVLCLLFLFIFPPKSEYNL